MDVRGDRGASTGAHGVERLERRASGARTLQVSDRRFGIGPALDHHVLQPASQRHFDGHFQRLRHDHELGDRAQDTREQPSPTCCQDLLHAAKEPRATLLQAPQNLRAGSPLPQSCGGCGRPRLAPWLPAAWRPRTPTPARRPFGRVPRPVRRRQPRPPLPRRRRPATTRCVAHPPRASLATDFVPRPEPTRARPGPPGGGRARLPGARTPSALGGPRPAVLPARCATSAGPPARGRGVPPTPGIRPWSAPARADRRRAASARPPHWQRARPTLRGRRPCRRAAC